MPPLLALRLCHCGAIIGCQADLELRAKPPPEGDIGILVGLKTGHIIMHTSGLSARVTAVRKGTVTAIPDLVNAHMSVELRYGNNDDLWIGQLLAQAVATKLFAIRIGTVSVPVSIRSTPSGTPGHGHVLAVDFPSSEEALWQRSPVEAHGS